MPSSRPSNARRRRPIDERRTLNGRSRICQTEGLATDEPGPDRCLPWRHAGSAMRPARGRRCIVRRRSRACRCRTRDVAKVALLARLRLSPDELETFTGQLNSIVDYVAQLQELDTTGVEPLAHGVEVRNVFRDDVRGPSHSPASRRWPTPPSGTTRASWSPPCWNERPSAGLPASDPTVPPDRRRSSRKDADR